MTVMSPVAKCHLAGLRSRLGSRLLLQFFASQTFPLGCGDFSEHSTSDVQEDSLPSNMHCVTTNRWLAARTCWLRNSSLSSSSAESVSFAGLMEEDVQQLIRICISYEMYLSCQP